MISSKLPDVGTTIFSVMTALANDHKAINLAQGFPDYSPASELLDLVARALYDGHNQYAPMPGLLSLREAVSTKYRTLYGLSYDPVSEVTITPGGTAALYTAIATVVRTDDEVLIFEPAYDSYAPAIRANGGVPIPCRLHAPSYRPDWDVVRSLITDRTAMIIVNTPHNPTGTVWPADDRATLAAVVDGTRIVVLSDEVYDHICFDGLAPSCLAQQEGLRERTFVVTSFGKTFHATGWKIGACVAPSSLMAEFRKVHQFLAFSVHTPTQVALATYMSDPSSYMNVGSFYERKRDLFRSLLLGSSWKIMSCEGSYFQLLGYRDFSDEADTVLAERLTKEIGVASIPLSPFTTDGVGDGVLRFCFAKNDATLEEAALRLRAL